MNCCEDDVVFTWRTIREDEAREVHALHAHVASLTPAGMVRPDPLAHFQRHVAECGRILGCFADDELVAYGVLGLHSPTVDHMGTLLDLDAQQRARLCVLDGAACLPEWRGRRLHCAGIEERMALGRELGRTLVAATVAPENMRSLRGLLKEGFTVRRYAIVYGGLARLVVQRDLLLPPPQSSMTQMHVAACDHAGHQRAMADGLQGTRCWQDPSQQWFVDYA
ncbi:hypothetical protein GCM10027277_02590 [Pseudoduganella ginsengisoli]|uniref:N-acetyltransferase domain-containing protein n=1 Tax=Pseudoduganella ginsengisoli TaxID=1462440 RepID=A0A6L6Q582_9BURK|nr:hypothetical protein [Pseudoduganella ginsengisoli]MTW04695.1 hypothetical protein [Pseudoduganella ginsengisoli]